MAIMDVLQDEPVIRTSFVNVDALRPPNVIFRALYNFTLYCAEIRIRLNDSKTIPVNCIPDITQHEIYDQFYFGFYQPSQDVTFLNHDNNNAILSLIELSIDFGDNFPAGPLMMDIIAVDSDYDPITESIRERRVDNDPFNLTVAGMNAYSLGANQFYLLKFSRIIKESIIPSWKNDFGITPNYETKSNIISNLSGGPLNLTNLNASALMMQPMGIGVVSVQVDREIRTHTYLGSIGLIGGADTLRPWGLVQLYCCGISRLTRNKLKKSLPTIPFFNTDIKDRPPIHDLSDLSLDEKIDLIPKLQSRIDSLELFLRDYVVDVHYLDGIRDKSSETGNSTKNTENMSNLNNQAIHTVSKQQQEDDDSTK
ncbi:hypothetical protein C1645_831539 [Glomus cerebriforme]|uniref:Uncharacterized protein n=1 Tax=Glomus cerebriforme TaxID=658196 RepID=A0A397SFF3_9GLOM|nr:hypothetical protein C1645_831539 [Glomus cerebriforme]